MTVPVDLVGPAWRVSGVDVLRTVADRGLGRLNWAESAPRGVASRTPAIDVGRT